MITKKFKKYDCIFKEGTMGDSAYMIDSGKVGIISGTDKNGQRRVVALLRKNDIFGEMGLIDGKPRSATVKALSKNKVTVLSQDCFNTLEDINPKALMPLLKVLTTRVREAFRLANLENSNSI